MPRKISFINYKGGVGKTSCIVNVASCLAKKGKRVLLVDLDTQSNSSVWLMRLERWNELNATGERSVYGIFDPGKLRIKDCIFRDVVENKDGEKLLPGLDLLPTTFNLIDLEQEFLPDPKKPPFVLFREQIAEIENDYDFIFFDCPPNLLRASQCGLFSSHEVYVPSNPDALSLIGFTLLVSKLHKFNQVSASFRTSDMGRSASIAGIIFNSIKANMDIKVPMMRVQVTLNQFKNQKRVHPKAKICNCVIRDAVVVRRAVTLGLPVCLIGQAMEDEDGVLQDYQFLAREIEIHNLLEDTN
jgi:chromosome partitioning protein